MDRKLHQVGVLLLISAGFMALVGFAFAPPQPEFLSKLAGMGTGSGVQATATGVGGFVFVGSTLFLARHFAGVKGEAWAFPGTVSLLLGGVALAWMAVWGMPEPSGFLGVGGFAGSHNGGLRSMSWPPWLSWLGLIIGIGSAGVSASGVSLGAASAVPQALGYLWLAGTRALFMRIRRADGQVPVAGPPAETLRERLEQGKRLSLEDALGIGRRMVVALEYPHRPDATEPEAEPEPTHLEVAPVVDAVRFEYAAADAADQQNRMDGQVSGVLARHTAGGEVRSDVFREWLSDPNFVRH